jgi:hypothetical protein
MNKELTFSGLVFLGLTLNSADAALRLPPSNCLTTDLSGHFDNDYANDYVDWYLMALASAGEIRYKGISTSSSVAPYNRHMPAEALDDCVSLRAKIVSIGRASGLRNVPDPVAGTRGHLVKPASGKIEDTKPIDAPGSRQIVREARAATAEKPLVVCVGGPLTAVADAYLLTTHCRQTRRGGLTITRWNVRLNGWSDDGRPTSSLKSSAGSSRGTAIRSPASEDRLRNELPASPMASSCWDSADVVAPEGDAMDRRPFRSCGPTTYRS